jgi:hypothetical protein
MVEAIENDALGVWADRVAIGGKPPGWAPPRQGTFSDVYQEARRLHERTPSHVQLNGSPRKQTSIWAQGGPRRALSR